MGSPSTSGGEPMRQRCGVAGIGHIQQRLKSRFILRRDTVCGPPAVLAPSWDEPSAEQNLKLELASNDLAKVQPARLAVLMIEAGGGLSLGLGMARSRRCDRGGTSAGVQAERST